MKVDICNDSGRFLDLISKAKDGAVTTRDGREILLPEDCEIALIKGDFFAFGSESLKRVIIVPEENFGSLELNFDPEPDSEQNKK